MAEMIEDGRTGWLAAEASRDSLAEALKRALDTPPARIAEMGHQASAAIRRMCDNEKIVESHLAFRGRLVEQGARRSLHLPANLPLAKSALSDESARRRSQKNSGEGIAVIVTCRQRQSPVECLRSLERQTQIPASVVIASDGPDRERALAEFDGFRTGGWTVIDRLNGGAAERKNAAIESVLGSGSNPAGFVFLDADHRPEPAFIAECEAALRQCPEVGLVSFWTRSHKADGKLAVAPCPAFPYQWAADEAAPFSAVRTEALREVGNFRAIMDHGYENWDLFNATMAAGWAAVTIPAVLGICMGKRDLSLRSPYDHVPGRMREMILARFPDLIARDAADIILYAEARAFHLSPDDSFNLKKRLALARTAIRSPLKTTALVLDRIKKAAYRAAARASDLVNP
jgi:GT2 family glycosyltransferase